MSDFFDSPCPHCRAPLRYPIEFGGLPTSCPRCQGMYRHPLPPPKLQLFPTAPAAEEEAPLPPPAWRKAGMVGLAATAAAFGLSAVAAVSTSSSRTRPVPEPAVVAAHSESSPSTMVEPTAPSAAATRAESAAAPSVEASPPLMAPQKPPVEPPAEAPVEPWKPNDAQAWQYAVLAGRKYKSIKTNSNSDDAGTVSPPVQLLDDALQQPGGWTRQLAEAAAVRVRAEATRYRAGLKFGRALFRSQIQSILDIPPLAPQRGDDVVAFAMANAEIDRLNAERRRDPNAQAMSDAQQGDFLLRLATLEDVAGDLALAPLWEEHIAPAVARGSREAPPLPADLVQIGVLDVVKFRGDKPPPGSGPARSHFRIAAWNRGRAALHHVGIQIRTHAFYSTPSGGDERLLNLLPPGRSISHDAGFWAIPEWKGGDALGLGASPLWNENALAAVYQLEYRLWCDEFRQDEWQFVEAPEVVASSSFWIAENKNPTVALRIAEEAAARTDLKPAAAAAVREAAVRMKSLASNLEEIMELFKNETRFVGVWRGNGGSGRVQFQLKAVDEPIDLFDLGAPRNKVFGLVVSDPAKPGEETIHYLQRELNDEKTAYRLANTGADVSGGPNAAKGGFKGLNGLMASHYASDSRKRQLKLDYEDGRLTGGDAFGMKYDLKAE